MEGEVTFYDAEQLDQLPEVRRPLWYRDAADVTSTLGRLYAEWNANQRRTIDEYDRRRRSIEIFWRSHETGTTAQ